MKKEEKKMTTDNHSRGLERSQSKIYKKDDSKENGKKMS